jgi:hypothetical protein
MENFGERLSVDDIWRVVLFVKTIPNHTLRRDVVPEPKDYIPWSPSKELLAWLKSRQKPASNILFSKAQSRDPFMDEATRVFPGLGPADRIVVKGLGTSLSLRDAAAGIRQIYDRMLNAAWADARRRGDKLPPASQKAIPPTVPGQQ